MFRSWVPWIDGLSAILPILLMIAAGVVFLRQQRIPQVAKACAGVVVFAVKWPQRLFEYAVVFMGLSRVPSYLESASTFHLVVLVVWAFYLLAAICLFPRRIELRAAEVLMFRGLVVRQRVAYMDIVAVAGPQSGVTTLLTSDGRALSHAPTFFVDSERFREEIQRRTGLAMQTPVSRELSLGQVDALERSMAGL